MHYAHAKGAQIAYDMDLRTYLDSLPPGGVSAFASKVGIGRVYLSQLAAKLDGRQPSPSLCSSIVRESGGVVTHRELRDDWRAIWPDLERRVDERKAA